MPLFLAYRDTISGIPIPIYPKFLCSSLTNDISRHTVLFWFGRYILDLFTPCIPVLVRNLKASRKRRIRFVSLFRLCHNNCIYKTSRNNGVTWTRRCINQTVYLYDNFSPVCFYRLTDGKSIAGHKHIIECDISLSVCCCSFDQCDRNLRKLVIQEFVPVYFYMFYQ